MAEEIFPTSFPLTALSYKSRSLVSCLLNSRKVLPSDSPQKLPRDWRGLACLTSISSEIAAGIECMQDKTARVLELWVQRKDGSATVGNLFQYLQRIDRYDVYDDLQELLMLGELVDERTAKPESKAVCLLEDVRDDLITFDDVQYGEPQLYHAYILFAREDKEFVDELITRMRGRGFKICTQDDVLPGHTTRHEPISNLISQRCHQIVVICSPDFFKDPANLFYINHAQAVGIEEKKRKIIPCMYRACALPTNLSFYHQLHYSPPGQKAVYDFWDKLAQSLQLADLPRIANGASLSSLRITELAGAELARSMGELRAPPPPPPDCPPRSRPSLAAPALGDGGALARKKLSPMRKILNTLKGKKHKEKAIMLAN